MDYLLSSEAIFPEMREIYISTCRHGTVNTTFLQKTCQNFTFLSMTYCSIEAHVEFRFSDSEKTTSNITSKLGLDVIDSELLFEDKSCNDSRF